MRVWDKAEAKENAEITRVADKASKKGKAETEKRARATVRVRVNATKSAVEEASTEIRAGPEAERAERDRAEAEARAWG